MTDKPNLLTLPVEILQAIAQDVDTSTFRLTCKTIDSAVFDVFARKYLRSLECFVLAPERLRRLGKLLSGKKLAQKIQNITLSLDPFESKTAREISLASRKPLEEPEYPECHWCEQNDARKEHIEGQYEKHGREVPRVDLLLGVLRGLKISQASSVALRLQPYRLQSNRLRYSHESHEMTRTEIPKDVIQAIFSAVFQSACDLSELRVDNNDFLPPALRDGCALAALKTCSRNITTFSITSVLDDLVIGPGGAHTLVGGRYWTPLSVMTGAEKLQSLHLEGWSHLHHQRGVCNTGIQYTSTILNANKLPALQRLELVRVDIQPGSLMAALKRCSFTLEILLLDDVYITSVGQHWLRILGQLLDCAQLVDLTICLLQEESKSCWANLVDPSDLEGPWRMGLVLDGRSEVEQALALNILTGLPFGGRPGRHSPL